MRPRTVPGLANLGLVLTADCNLRCRYCSQDRKRPAFMAWPVLRAALDVLFGGSGEDEYSISFSGGEPLLAYPLIRRAITYIERSVRSHARVATSVLTNGTLLDARRARFLLEHGAQITLSFDGLPLAQDHRAGGSFAHLDRVLSLLRSRHADAFSRQLRVTVMVYPPTLKYLAASIDYFLEQQVPEVTIAPAMGSWRWSLSDIEQLDAQFATICQASKRHYEATGRIPVTLFRHPELDLRWPIGEWCCGVCSGRSLVVDVDGQVYPCMMLIRSCQTVAPPPMGRRLGRLALGHITDPGLADRVARLPQIARGLEIFARQDRKRSSYAECGRCPSVGGCVICPVGSRRDRGVTGTLQVSDFLCAFNRVAFDYRRRFPPQWSTATSMPTP